jgi:hypothetical protein
MRLAPLSAAAVAEMAKTSGLNSALLHQMANWSAFRLEKLNGGSSSLAGCSKS